MATAETVHLIGITNENEFYSRHYLAEVFRGDIAETLKRRREEEGRPPHRRLADLYQSYFKMRGQAERTQDPIKRLADMRTFHNALLDALDLPHTPRAYTCTDGTVLPTSAVLGRPDQAPQLIILEVFHDQPPERPGEDGRSVLAGVPQPCQYADGDHTPPTTAYENLLGDCLLTGDHPPRRVLLLDDGEAVLVDRYKWAANRVLRFDFAEILGRRDEATLGAMAVLLHRESLCPEGTDGLLEHLDENAHRHAHGVSDDLKYALREAIELLGNEALHSLRTQGIDPFHGPHALNESDFSRECLRFMYRLLFLFYIEARPELKYVPIRDNSTYRLGYSLESLRDLEMVRLETKEAREGTYLHQSLQRLFHLIFHGYQGTRDHNAGVVGAFTIPPLDSHLFDPARTPTLQRVELRNQVVQDIIRNMSLTRPAKKGRKTKRRGRVSYAQLGINQLGEVYEALLSYRGFFAREDLYEVKKAGTKVNLLDTGYFVNATDLEAYTEEEKVIEVIDGYKTLKMHPQGNFIYRMAGRDKQMSASYYTPEKLTNCLVEYCLKELLKDAEDGTPFPADDILKLTICEPAMGSAAFLNAAVDQLAEQYLIRKQQELDRRIPHDAYPDELQKVKMHIADHNCFGVDLNPVAVELAEVSLWLNAIHGTDQVPWFGYQLFAGNSLVGARRQVYHKNQLRLPPRGKKEDLWYHHGPERLTPTSLAGGDGGRSPDQVYHFLLPDPGMADYRDKVVKSLKPDEINTINAWRKAFCKPFERAEIKKLQAISTKIDVLWTEHTRILRNDRNNTEDPQPVWPEEADVERSRIRTSTREKDRRRAEGLFNFERPFASPMMQLKMVMDYWCSLWYWPIEKAHLLPTRDVFLHHVETILAGENPDGFLYEIQDSLFSEERNHLEVKAEELREGGQVSVERIHKFYPQLAVVDLLAKRYRFFHWELIFADVFADRTGFDLFLGNPPWLKVEWKEAGVMGDDNPLFALRKFSAKKVADLRKKTLAQKGVANYLADYEASTAYQRFLNAIHNYPMLKGLKTNLYKCFLPLAWMAASEKATGYAHPEGVFDDPKGGSLRSLIFQRLRHHYQFVNERKLFKEADHHLAFSLNVYGTPKSDVGFLTVSNLFDPLTLRHSWQHRGEGPVPGIKNDTGNWELTGHQSRILTIDEKALTLFAKLYDKEGTPWREARLPAIYSVDLLKVLKKLAHYPTHRHKYVATEFWNETSSQKKNIIKRVTSFPTNEDTWIISGPHIFVGNPLYKTPRKNCNLNADYDSLDLTEAPSNYLPRTNFIPDCSQEMYQSKIPIVSWGEKEVVTKYFRLVFRQMVQSSSMRTITPAIIPPRAAHINSCTSMAFEDTRVLCTIAASASSLIGDFYIKTTGKTQLHASVVEKIPLVENDSVANLLIHRILMLNCLTDHYADLWTELWCTSFQVDSWSKPGWSQSNRRLWTSQPQWNRDSALRTDLERQQALLEIDVLVTIGLGLTLEELITIYQVQFYLMQQYEKETFYDQKGRIVFTINRGLVGVGLNRKPKKDEPPCTITHPDGTQETGPMGWEDVRDLPEGATVSQTKEDDTLPGGPRPKTITYHAPFFRCDRVADYRIAWAEFTRRLAEMEQDENK